VGADVAVDRHGGDTAGGGDLGHRELAAVVGFPASGSDPKLADAFFRYTLTTFTYGSNLGPAQAARHMAGVSAHELGATFRRHMSISKLNKAIADVVDAFTELDLVRAWGDGATVAADGTQVETFIDNLLAETSIRYGGTGGIAYRYISDTDIALFSKFIPCGVWEAVYLIEGLIEQESKVKPDTVHADTQGQSFPVFALAHFVWFRPDTADSGGLSGPSRCCATCRIRSFGRAPRPRRTRSSRTTTSCPGAGSATAGLWPITIRRSRRRSSSSVPCWPTTC